MPAALLRRYRLILGFFIAALVLSGVTAFPLSLELDLLARFLGIAEFTPSTAPHDLGRWILTVRDGLREMYAAHPWIAYGTDWLAFAHLVLAVFFIGPYRDPVRNVWVLHARPHRVRAHPSARPHLRPAARHSLLLAPHRLLLRRHRSHPAAVVPQPREADDAASTAASTCPYIFVSDTCFRRMSWSPGVICSGRIHRR